MIDTISYLNSGTLSAGSGDAVQGTQGYGNELGKDAFMQLLVTQMVNQDPLEPMDNTEFLSQMAQFSSLEQMQNISQGMQLLALSQTAATNSSMVNLIGKRVITPGNQFTFDGSQPVKLSFDITDGAKPVKLQVRDSKNEIVGSMDLTDLQDGKNNVLFDGKKQDGSLLPRGTYTYEVVDAEGKAMSTVTLYANYLVDSVQFNGSSILLKSGEQTIALGDISEIILN